MNSNLTRSLLAVATAIAVLPGIILVISPQTVLGIYGFQLDNAGAFAARMQGILLVGLAVVYWFARNAAEQPLQTTVLIAGLLINAVTTVIVLLSVVNGTINAAGWPAALLHGALTLGFAYALYIRRR
jgi:hypothetical protein